MKTKIKELIEKSTFFDDKTKSLYLKLVDFIPQASTDQLHKIIGDGVEGIVDIEKDAENQKSEVNKQYLEELDQFSKQAKKEAIQEEESDEKKQSEKILKNLSDL